MAKKTKRVAKKAVKKTAKPAKKRAASTELHLEGVTLCFAGRPGYYGRSADDFKSWAREEGATVQTKLSADTDLLVILDKGATATAKKQADKLNQQGAAIAVISERDFQDRLFPAAEEVIKLLKNGKSGRERLQALTSRSQVWQTSHVIDLAGADLRGLNFSDVNMSNMNLNLAGADLSEANLYGAETEMLSDARLDKAQGEYFRPGALHNCSCKGVRLKHMGFYGWGQKKKILGCDFTDADLDEMYCSYETVEKTNFKNAVLKGAEFVDCTFVDVSFDGADLSNAKLSGSQCQGKVSFVGAKMNKVNAKKMKFHDADLRQADLSGTRLDLCSFKNANLAGTNFSNAILYGASFEGTDTSKAKNLELPPFTKVTTGKACRDLNAAANKANKLTVEASVELPKGKVSFSAIGSISQVYRGGSYRVEGVTQKAIEGGVPAKSLADALEQLGEMWGHGRLLFDSIKASASKSPLKGKALKELAEQALGEVFGTAPPTEEELKAKKQKRKQSQDQVSEVLLAELRGGRKGILEFNKRNFAELATKQKVEGIKKEDFSGASLGPLRVSGFGFTNCTFDSSSLKKARLSDCDLRKSTFREADMNGCNLKLSNLAGCDLSRATLSGAKLSNAVLDKATLVAADLSGADLTNVSLLGTNLADAKLTKVKWKANEFDEATTFPAKFRIPKHFQFVGKGDDPRVAAEQPMENVQDFDTFMAKLKAGVDASRLANALKMLKADRFELFSDVTTDSIVGVVKSQSDPDLVYSCRLTSGGEFCCCTQNLNACGGLRGALCKHLLVLLVGLTKNEALSPTSAATWARASGRRKPALDKDAMAETLLKYKGAEAGEVDWRPTETVPEDFYAF